MNNQSLDGSECPICIDTLKPPVRMLLCGHSFCQTCLEQLSLSSSQLKCPTCRQGMQLISDGIRSLTRNFALENMIESFKKIKFDQFNLEWNLSFPHTALSGDATSQLSSAVSFINEKRYEEAIQILKAIRLQANPVNQILTLFDKVKYLIEVNLTDDAVVCCFEIFSLIESNIATDEFQSSCEQIEANLKSLIENFTKIKQDGCIVFMIQFWFDLVQRFLKEELLIAKIVDIAVLVRCYSLELKNRNKADDIKGFCPLMNKMYITIQMTDTVCFMFKCFKVNYFLYQHGLICHYVRDWFKSLEIYNEAISVLETALGAGAEKHQIMGNCYNNLGFSWENLNEKDKAKFYYEKSIEIFESATDYENEENRQSHLTHTKYNLRNVSAK